MVDAAPFRAVRYNASVAGPPATTSAPAYEDPERFTYARHRTVSPYTVLELLLPGPGGYQAAGATLRRWFRTGVLLRDEHPAFYRYEQHELRHGVPAVQRGLLCAVHLEDMATSDAILPHEEVEPERVIDRLDRLDAVPIDLSPVYAFTIGAAAAFRDALAGVPDRPPAVALTDEDGVDHRVWSVTAPDRIADFRTALASARLVLADGHHRYATAVAYARRRAASPEGNAPWRRTLMYVVDCNVDGPDLDAVHRLIDPLPEHALTALARDFVFVPAPGDVRELLHALSQARGRAFGLRRADGSAAVLVARDDARLRRRLPADRSDIWRSLDAAVLAHAVLPRLKLSADAARPVIDPFDAAGRMSAASRSALLLLRPTDIATVAALATAREPLPAKSTLFRPKPRTGLVMRDVSRG